MEKLPGNVKPDTDEQVFFYEQDFYVLSNFSAFNLQWSGLTFPTSEHAYHWLKFNRGGGGTVIQREIASAPSAHEAFKIAERNKQFRRPDWDEVKVDIMLDILRAKAAQHEYVRRKLLATGDRELIEDSWRDDFWGWGPNRDGRNQLGKLWMQVRSEIRGSAPALGVPVVGSDELETEPPYRGPTGALGVEDELERLIDELRHTAYDNGIEFVASGTRNDGAEEEAKEKLIAHVRGVGPLERQRKEP